MQSAIVSESAILSLPTELLDRILDFFPRKCDVVQMQKAHRRFQDSARQVILKDVHLHVQCESDAYNFLELNNFYNIICNTDYISQIVQKLTFEFGCGPQCWRSDPTCIPLGLACLNYDVSEEWISTMESQLGLVEKLLAKVPKVINITLRLTGEDGDYPANDFLFKSLESVIKSCGVPVSLECYHSSSAVRHYPLNLRNLETVSFERDLDPNHVLGSLHDDSIIRSRKLRVHTLDLGPAEIGRSEPAAGVGACIATAFPRLVHFRGRLAQYIDVVYFIPSLYPLKDILQTIDLQHTPWNVRRAPSNTVPVDFKIFPQLRTLRISSGAWLQQLPCNKHMSRQPVGFIWRLPNEGRMNIHAHLPLSLEELAVSFVWPNAIFARGWTYTNQFKLLPTKVQMKGFDWILGLLKTNLEKIMLTEEAGGDHTPCDHWGRGDSIWHSPASPHEVA